MSKIKVMVIDDSALTRQLLTKILEQDRELEVIATAVDPLVAVRKMEVWKPDVITLDMEMPRMDGLTFLKKLMNQRPLPVVVISGATQKGSARAIEALENGAMEIISKPDVSHPERLAEIGESICRAIKAAYAAKVTRRQPQAAPAPKPTFITRPSRPVQGTYSQHVVAIGASTGGTEAIKEVLQGLPAQFPGIVVVQHMPPMFTKQFAARLNAISPMQVKEAEPGDPVLEGQVLIAPGDQHMILVRSTQGYHVELLSTERVNRHRPSVDVLFRSVAQTAHSDSTGVLLTGMGADGAQGLLAMEQAGALTIAQDEATSVVYGMPKAAHELGAVQEVLPLPNISAFLQQSFNLV